MASGGPWAYHPHVGAWVAVAVAATALVMVRRRATGATGGRRRGALVGGLVALAVALTWPVADLAGHWSLTALVVQRLLLTMLAAPLLMLAVPAETWAAVTSPRVVDDVFAFVTRPPAAIVVFTVVVFTTLLPPVVSAQVSSAWADGLVDAAVVAGGVVLWAPVLRHLPGANRAGPLGTAGYLFAQSVVPAFPSVLYIFAQHPLYPSIARAHGVFGLSTLADQRLAGMVGKVGTLPVLWTVAYVILTRAQHAEATGADPEPWHWLDVRRRLERAERDERRGRRPRTLRPPSATGRQLPVVYPPGWTEEPGGPAGGGPPGG